MLKFLPEEIIQKIENECWNVECEDVPTGGDDCDVIWCIYSHHMSKPHKRLEGQGNTIIEAFYNVFSEYEDINENDEDDYNLSGYSREDEDWFFDMDGKG